MGRLLAAGDHRGGHPARDGAPRRTGMTSALLVAPARQVPLFPGVFDKCCVSSTYRTHSSPGAGTRVRLRVSGTGDLLKAVVHSLGAAGVEALDAQLATAVLFALGLLVAAVAPSQRAVGSIGRAASPARRPARLRLRSRPSPHFGEQNGHS